MRRATSIYNFHFDIVHGCQLRCLGCPNSTLQPKIKRIGVEDFRRCLANVDVDWVHTLRLFSFGEPLLHKELSRVVACIPEQKWKVSIVELSTNAQQVYWDDFEEMLKLEVVNRLVVSCDGDGTPEEYERVRPPAKWDKLMEFLERARYLRDRWSPATQLVTRSVVREAEDKERWLKVLKPLGWTPEFRGWMSLPQAAENMVQRELQIPDGVCFFLADAETFTSHPWAGQINLLHVDWDGTVVPCCAHPSAGNFGNLKEQTYNEILTGEARRRFIQTMQENRRAMPICGQCEMGPVGNEGPSFAAGAER
jgi:radical SAM protein with 4Fe4S-binding SPASM domain